MRQIQFFKITTILLLLLNISFLAFFFLTKPKPHVPQGRPNFLEQTREILKLDEDQFQQFELLAKNHNDSIEPIRIKQKEILNHYFQTVSSKNPTLDTTILLKQFQQLEVNKIHHTYNHFKEVKSILNPNQLKYFERFMNDVLKVLNGKKEKKPPPPKDF